jgi:hypothetical protein
MLLEYLKPAPEPAPYPGAANGTGNGTGNGTVNGSAFRPLAFLDSLTDKEPGRA